MRSKEKGFLSVFGPGWITMMADMDAPSTAAAIASGSEFGYRLVLLMLILIVPLYIFQEMAARLGAVTGKGFISLVKERYGKKASAVTAGGVFFVDGLSYVGEFAGIATGAELLGIPLLYALLMAFTFHTVIVFTKSYTKVEKMLMIISGFLLLFVVMAFISRPNPSALLRGLSPLQSYLDPSLAFMVTADIGAVIMPFMIFYQQSAVVDKKLSETDVSAEKLETLLGGIATQFLMICVIVASAAVSKNVGSLTSVSEMGSVFYRLAGKAGIIIFSLGLIAAGFLAAVTISLASAYGISEYFGWKASLNHKKLLNPFYIIYFVEVIPAVVIIAAFRQVVPIMIDAMALNGLVLVFPLTLLIKLSGDEKVLGRYKNGKKRQVIAWAMAIIILSFAVFSFAISVPRTLLSYGTYFL
ncbi:MAG: NRAMP family divalent metal transporter [Thermoprotei archaeon]